MNARPFVYYLMKSLGNKICWVPLALKLILPGKIFGKMHQRSATTISFAMRWISKRLQSFLARCAKKKLPFLMSWTTKGDFFGTICADAAATHDLQTGRGNGIRYS